LTNTSGYSPDNPQAIKSIDVNPLSVNSIKKATAIGLVAGLGFSLLENAVYAASDFNVLPLRIITAAVHGACGSRIGAAAVMLRSNPLQAILRILTATAIHGIYNLMITMPGLSPIAAILIAISALVTAILTIRGGWSEDTANTVYTEKHNSGNAAPLFPKRELDKNGENS
jgi:RsiW-degrading membrane proteinase PrsW (M82 family)